jgi:hypothetical protein
MRRLPAMAALVAAAAGCVLAPACITWEPGGTSPCDDFVPNQKDVTVLGSWACAIAQEGHLTNGATNSTMLTGEMCDRVCGPGFGNCQLPEQYIQAFLAAQTVAAPEASADGDVTADALTVQSDAGDGLRPETEADADAGSSGQSLCPNILQSQEFIVLCSNSC